MRRIIAFDMRLATSGGLTALMQKLISYQILCVERDPAVETAIEKQKTIK